MNVYHKTIFEVLKEDDRKQFDKIDVHSFTGKQQNHQMVHII